MAVISLSTAPAVVRHPGRLRSSLAITASGTVLALAVIAALFPRLLSHVDPLYADPAVSLHAPSTAHWAGTDLQGRDVYSRIIHGARYSLSIGLGATMLGLFAGLVLGILASTGPRWLDYTVGRAIDILAAFPEVLLALLFIALTGPGVPNLIVAIGIAGIPKYARLVRTQVLQTRQSGYVEQARTFGVTGVRSLLRHILPNALGSLPIIATIALGEAIVSSAGLSFLGLGPQPPAPEWGLMISESRDYLRHAWWLGVFPGAAVTTVVIAATALGRTLQARYERRSA
ncbi:ABC transporter permease [Acidipropionibacterium jensenii]|uniref:Glutathione transport system permease protein gsiD n=1 Tax=Acidipropionibacterium jensenii TaxID=1749 RepID=A0A3S4VJU5_9ACTN|nr:ABC transporter permease [Acidipropionibacterium jensenii]MDN5977122.1 ABC transporter permease [Acidipropionibacterium jensenii]MDN5996080.1 ABC transporter permease [Acidipropionibacterium jensenii]MDN6020995.1 ABC transporter permease [Acidipropionibacterium jensenii]MDN6441031.1 ABC transporter permease [Acidipropionibacterium jensenii]MDN6479921.1 ABC transporter permease [Acidipropionibacterium jensenii]